MYVCALKLFDYYVHERLLTSTQFRLLKVARAEERTRDLLGFRLFSRQSSARVHKLCDRLMFEQKAFGQMCRSRLSSKYLGLIKSSFKYT
jgi:hypothetical protein